MHVLSISTDRNIFTKGSRVRERIRSQAAAVSRLSLIVFSTKAHATPSHDVLGNTVEAHATNSRNRWFYGIGALRIARSLQGIDLVTTQDPFEAGLVGFFIARKRKIPLQLQIHTDVFSPEFIQGSFLNRIRVKLARFLIARADCVRVVSERIAQSIVEQGLRRDKPVVLPVFSDLSKLQTAIPSFNLKSKYPMYEQIILLVGRLSPEKDIETALRVMREVLVVAPRAGFIMVGDGPLRRDIEMKARVLGVAPRLEFVGWQEDLVPYLRGADALLHTSRFEGYGLVLLEAAMFGVPVVSTDVGIMGSILLSGEHAFACPVGDHACLAKQLTLVLLDPVTHNRISENAKQRIEELRLPNEKEYLQQLRDAFTSCTMHS